MNKLCDQKKSPKTDRNIANANGYTGFLKYAQNLLLLLLNN